MSVDCSPTNKGRFYIAAPLPPVESRERSYVAEEPSNEQQRRTNGQQKCTMPSPEAEPLLKVLMGPKQVPTRRMNTADRHALSLYSNKIRGQRSAAGAAWQHPLLFCLHQSKIVPEWSLFLRSPPRGGGGRSAKGETYTTRKESVYYDDFIPVAISA